MKKISVCMATFNGANYLREQIESILPQLSPQDELLVADDGSTDETLLVLEEYKKRIRLVFVDKVGGVVQNFSRMLNVAGGDIIVLADQDDVWLDGRLERIRRELLLADMVMLNAKIVNRDLLYGGTTLFLSRGYGRGFLRNLYKNSFVGCCMAVNRNILQVALPMPKFIHMHDWYLGMVAVAFFRVAYVQQPYLMYRRHDATASQTGNKSNYTFARQLFNRIGLLLALIIVWFRWVGKMRAYGAKID